jgi:hypothetical protein
MIARQSIEQIMRHADAPQRILWNEVIQIVGEHAAVRMLYFHGTIVAGTPGIEFGTYSANKIYVALRLWLGNSGDAIPGAAYQYNLMNLSNVAAIVLKSNSIADDGAGGLWYMQQFQEIKDVYFSRITSTPPTNNFIRFIGYRIIF